MKTAVELSPKEEIPAPGVWADIRALLAVANSGNTSAQLSVYRWWDYCQQNSLARSDDKDVCADVSVDPRAKQEMLLKVARRGDWRAVEHLFAEYVAATQSSSSNAVGFQQAALELLSGAAESGVAEAAKHVGLIYLNGVGVPKDSVKAFAYLDRYMVGREDADVQAILARLRLQMRHGDWLQIDDIQKRLQ